MMSLFSLFIKILSILRIFSLASSRSLLRCSWKAAIHSDSTSSRISSWSLSLMFVPNKTLKGVDPILLCGNELRYCWALIRYLCHSDGLGAASFVNTDINVRFTLFTWPFSLGTPVVIRICSMFSSSQYVSNSFEVNAVPRSDIILRGLPNIVACFLRRSKTSVVPVDRVAYSHINFENASATTKINR